MRFLNKKGISPLIATVLLIGFTVALAAVVILWGSGFVNRTTAATSEKTVQTLACTSDLSFEIRKVLCNNGAATPASTVTIDNKGSYVIKKLIFRSFDSTGNNKDVVTVQGTGLDSVDSQIDPYEIKEIDLTASPDNKVWSTLPGSSSPRLSGGVTRVEAIATINVEGVDVTCAEAVKQRLFTPAC